MQLPLIDSDPRAAWPCENCVSAHQDAEWYEVREAAVRLSTPFGSWRLCDDCLPNMQAAVGETGDVTAL